MDDRSVMIIKPISYYDDYRRMPEMVHDLGLSTTTIALALKMGYYIFDRQKYLFRKVDRRAKNG